MQAQRNFQGLALFDLDGCVFDDRHRRHHIDLKAKSPSARYAKYHILLKKDQPLEPALKVLQQLRDANAFIVFITARPIHLAQPTVDHIRETLGMEVHADYTLYMRPANDHSPSPELKQGLLNLINQFAAEKGTNIIAAFDDRQDVVDMYCANGIAGFILNEHGTNAPEPELVAPIPPMAQPEPILDAEFEELKGYHDDYRAEPATLTPDVLRQAADLFESRNGQYKDNAVIVGQVMAALFPEGVKIKTADDHHMYHLLELMVVKLTRFATSGLRHTDSIRDLIVYGAMVDTRHEKHAIEVL